MLEERRIGDAGHDGAGTIEDGKLLAACAFTIRAREQAPTRPILAGDLNRLLHALSERLDTRMAEHLLSPDITPRDYAIAWRACGEPASRQLQIELTMAVGESLDRLTRKPLLRQTLKLMRSPAQMAGLGALQHFLETGFDTFRAMRGAAEFLATVKQREEALAHTLFSGGVTAVT